MKLVELLRTKFVDGITELRPEQLKEMINELKDCTEFKDTDLIIADFPIMPDTLNTGRTISMATYRLHEGTKFGGISYLYHITLSPSMFEPQDLFTPVKDGCAISPIVYNMDTFKPRKKIMLTFELENDFGLIPLESNRAELHRKLDQILDNESDYLQQSKRSVMLRGYFPSMQSSNQVRPEPQYF